MVSIAGEVWPDTVGWANNENEKKVLMITNVILMAR